jgi:glycyl-tRNA synthetase beta subunit
MLLVKINFKGLAEILGVLPRVRDKAAEDFAERSAFFLLSQAKRYAPVDTGRLRSDLHLAVQLKGIDSTAEVGTEVKYAPAVEFGTKPHFPPPKALEGWVRRKGISARIAGKKRKAGTTANEDTRAAFIIARAISKKGTQAHPFLQPAKEDLEKDMDRRLVESFLRAKQRFGFGEHKAA